MYARIKKNIVCAITTNDADLFARRLILKHTFHMTNVFFFCFFFPSFFKFAHGQRHCKVLSNAQNHHLHLLYNDQNWCTTKSIAVLSAFQRFSLLPLISQLLNSRFNEPYVIKPDNVYAKTKQQISCAVTAHLICPFVFATQIV